MDFHGSTSNYSCTFESVGGLERSVSDESSPHSLSEAETEVMSEMSKFGEVELSEGDYDVGSKDHYRIDSEDDLGIIMFDLLSETEVRQFHFCNLDVAFDFYNEYGKARGFSVRKHKVYHSVRHGGILWKSFVCARQGQRQTKGTKDMEECERRAEPRSDFRCGCNAEFRVHLTDSGERWFVSIFDDEHNHELMKNRFCGRLRSHTGMTETDIAEMNCMRAVGISTPKVFATFGYYSGGIQNVGFNSKHMYNAIAKERKKVNGDAKAALTHLTQLASVDPKLYWKHEVDEGGKLCKLFWADGESQNDYATFGDVMAFDATYSSNKYKFPVVVFSGVNHHTQTIVFGCGVVSDEKESTYVWMLEHFLNAMKGKAPNAVITDGDKAMNNAIGRVFPQAHHRLCGWHLLHNANKKLHNRKFNAGFANVMFEVDDVKDFEEKWVKLKSNAAVEGVEWVDKLYERKHMWAAAHMKGIFYGGYRTTSRCKALHSQMGKYVVSGDSLYEFLQHFESCVNFMRNSEVLADLKSCYGDPIMQTYVPSLEMSGAKLFTRKIFYKYREALQELSSVEVDSHKRTASNTIYIVKRFGQGSVRRRWHVAHNEEFMEFRCTCKSMESRGIPCVHILSVLRHLEIHELPPCLVMNRWKKNAKEWLEGGGSSNAPNNVVDLSNRMNRLGALGRCCRRLCSVGCRSLEDFNKVRDIVVGLTENLLANNESSLLAEMGDHGNGKGFSKLKDPTKVRTKGCGARVKNATNNKFRRTQKCSGCRKVGHNIKRCPDLCDDDDVEHSRTNSFDMSSEFASDYGDEENGGSSGDVEGMD